MLTIERNKKTFFFRETQLSDANNVVHIPRFVNGSVTCDS